MKYSIERMVRGTESVPVPYDLTPSEWEGWDLVVIDLTVTANYSYTPARTWGDPGDCYPEEEDFEVLSAIGEDGQDWVDDLTESEIADIAERYPSYQAEMAAEDEAERRASYAEDY